MAVHISGLCLQIAADGHGLHADFLNFPLHGTVRVRLRLLGGIMVHNNCSYKFLDGALS